ncbi:sensor histidine kinase [Luteimicrobium subarcticum]|uniref:histidine kinase n=1 Tax=Luteimicrobium subarcticum TaxID=620910 RepID=A0A2M8W485_9MICO|nr:HAMP domain-containing sensor histidine kinase [Luteimicrobium subarcticum]PJI85727.1 two-component system sensor histidine kinase VanS [Luteimicrobium subarcticum]
MTRERGLSVRLKLTLSYAGLVMVAGVGLISVVLVFLLRYVPAEAVLVPTPDDSGGRPGPALFVPGRSDLWDAFAPKALLMLGLLLVFGLVGGWFLARRMLAPLTRITDAARVAADGTLSHRVRLPGRRDELRDLADAFDTMLERLEAQVAEQRRFAANASHELRTPLAVTQAMLAVAEQDPDRDVGALLARLRVVNTRAVDLTEALLVLSRADQGAFARERVDLSLLAEDAVETLLPLAEQRQVALEGAGDAGATTIGSPALLLQLTTNLVHNAIVHNLPTGGDVRVTTAASPLGVTLLVENTCDDLPPGLVATLAEPFQRGNGRSRADHPGVGLGLAIATSIVRAHRGTLALAPRPGGGLTVTVRLPRAGEP